MELEAMQEMLAVSATAQLLFEGETVLAVSPAVQDLFPAAQVGATAAQIFGPSAPELLEYNGAGSRIFTIEGEEQSCEVTLVAWQGHILATAERTQESDDLQTLHTIAERLSSALTGALAVTPQLLPQLEETEKNMLRAGELNRSLYEVLHIARNLQLFGISGKNSLTTQRVELGDWLRDFHTRLSPLFQELGLTLEFQCAQERHPCTISSQYLEKALLCLCSNAMKFSSAGETVVLSLRRRGNRLIVTLQDQGCGISASQMHSVFRRSAHRGRIPDKRWGVGVGLPIARGIVQAHGGSMMLESVEGQGTAVHLMLPVDRGHSTMLRSPVMTPKSSGLSPLLMELADVLPARLYDTRKVD